MKWKTYTLLCFSLLLCFTFGIGINTKCNAMTQEELIEMSNEMHNNYIFASDNRFSYIENVTNSTQFKNVVTDTFLEDYVGFLYRGYTANNATTMVYNYLFFPNASTTINLKYVSATPAINYPVYQAQSTIYNIKQVVCEYTIENGSISVNIGNQTQFGTSSTAYGNYYTAMYYPGIINNTSNENWIGYPNYVYINPHNITFDGNTYTADVRVGEYYNINNISYKLYMVQDNVETEIPFNYTINYQSGIYGQVGLFNITSLGILNNANCRLKMYNNNDLLYTSELFNITSNGNQGSTSGDQGGNGNINLTETNNLITNLTNVVESGNNKIIATLESGEKKAEERDNFWKQAYDNLFTISGDYITQKFEEIRQQYNISGDYEIEQQFLNQIQEQANDFIISWGTLTTHFSYGNYEHSTSQVIIPSGDINFSKLERENEDLHNSMEWARTIIGFSLGILLLRNYWTTLLLMLGIGIQVYDKEPTEKEAVTTQTITIDKKGNQTITETTKTGNLTIRRKK